MCGLMDNFASTLYNILNLRYLVAPVDQVRFWRTMLPPAMSTNEDRLRAFTQVAAALNSSLCLDDVLKRVLEAAAVLVPLQPVPLICIALYDAASNTWRIPAWNVPAEQAGQYPVPDGTLHGSNGLFSLLHDATDLIEIEDTSTDPRAAPRTYR